MGFLSRKFRVRLLTNRKSSKTSWGEHLVRSITPFLALLSFVSITQRIQAQHQHDSLTEQQLGTVHFPISCDAQVQKQFERGVALLHSFAFDTAETTFRQIVEDDPRCAMAHWGVAMTFSRWAGPDDKQRK